MKARQHHVGEPLTCKQYSHLTLAGKPAGLFSLLDEYLLAGTDDLDDGDPDSSVPPAFDEHPAIRNAYVHAFVLGAFHGCSQAVVRQHLVAQRGSLLDSLKDRPDDEDSIKLRADLAKMAMTLRSVEKRLRVDPDSNIIYYALCPTCWARYTMLEISEMDGDRCTQTRGCSATL